MSESSNLPTTALATALAASADLITDDDRNDIQREEPRILFAQVRQKDIKDQRGQMVRSAGAFCFGNKTDFTYEDRPELLLTIMGFTPGRVYFKDLNETQPTCKSDDMIHGTSERTRIDGRDVFGECTTCAYNKWGSALQGRGKRCKENRRLFCMDWSRNGPIVLTIGASSLRAWGAYDEAVRAEARRAFGSDAFIHHLLQVRATLDYVSEPSGHYVVQWRDQSALPMALQKKIAADRQEALRRFREAAERAEFENEETAEETPF